MKKLFTLFLSLTVIFVAAQKRTENNKVPAKSVTATISVAGLDAGLTPNDLVTSIVGPGVAFSNVSYTGAQGGSTASGGTFTGGAGIIGVDQGVILSSGRVFNAPGPNSSPTISANLGLPGDADLNAIFGITTKDATVLEFDFVPTADKMYVQYVLASDEYNEFLEFSDAFAFILDGTNIALVPSTTTPVSVGTVNPFSNASYFNNNATPPYPFDIEADGFTDVFTASATVVPNQSHHIKLVIADKDDYSLDTWVFIKGASFSTTNPAVVPTLSEWGLILLGFVMLGFGSIYILRVRAA